MTPGHVSSPNRRGRSVVDSIIMIALVCFCDGYDVVCGFRMPIVGVSMRLAGMQERNACWK